MTKFGTNLTESTT